MLEEKEKRTAPIILADIERMLASIDGISTADAFRLGGLVREYGQATAGDIAGVFVQGLGDAILKNRLPKSPWEK
jgi:hypothetical protein